MSIIYILIPIAVLLTSIGIYLFFWAVKTEQFDDLEKQGMSILFDEEEKEKKTNNESSDNHDDSDNEALNSDNSNSDNK
jgi:cbb3-type cytochrome oxidase maturation protein